jgi:hypothetical protein
MLEDPSAPRQSEDDRTDVPQWKSPRSRKRTTRGGRRLLLRTSWWISCCGEGESTAEEEKTAYSIVDELLYGQLIVIPTDAHVRPSAIIPEILVLPRIIICMYFPTSMSLNS